MKLFVFSASKAPCTTTIAAQPQANIIRLTALLAGGKELWTDTDDASIPDTEAAVRATYLTPNSIPVAAMGRLGAEPRSWWVAVSRQAIRMEDFYTVSEAVAANLFAEDPAALAWKDHYIFTAADGTELIGSLDYLGAARQPVADILPKLLCA